MKYDGAEHRRWSARVRSNEFPLLVLNAQFDRDIEHDLLGRIDFVEGLSFLCVGTSLREHSNKYACDADLVYVIKTTTQTNKNEVGNTRREEASRRTRRGTCSSRETARSRQADCARTN